MNHRTSALAFVTLASSIALVTDAQASPLWQSSTTNRSPTELRVDLDGDGVEELLEIALREDEPYYQPSETALVDTWVWREVHRVRGKNARELVFRAHVGFTRRGKSSVLPLARIERVFDFDGDGRPDIVYWQGDEDGGRTLLVIQEADGTFTTHDFGETQGDFPTPDFVAGDARVLPRGISADELKAMGVGDIAVDWDAKARRFMGRGLLWVRGDHVQVRAAPVDGKAVAKLFSEDVVLDEGASGNPDWIAVQTLVGVRGFVHRRFVTREVTSWTSKVRGQGPLPKGLRPLGASWVSDFDGDGVADRVRLTTMKSTPRGAKVTRLFPKSALPKAPLALVYDFADSRTIVVGLEPTGLMLPPISRRAISLKDEGGALLLSTEAGIDVELACPQRLCALVESDEEP